ncbi:L,D-transpeptidase [Ramlibacter sp.]|uniref:L,D-transpeptidase n=1 Tax=Ramlibacter sp. TaxID=1917967 RepID=UPI003D0BE0D4
MRSWANTAHAAVLGVLLAVAGGSAVAGAPALSLQAEELSQRILRGRDHAGKPFAIVDKRRARMHVFDRRGRLVASTPVLLGAAPGDHIVPGVGLRTERGEVREDDMTTPAGRFVSGPGRNHTGEHVVWVDYESAFAIHRVRPGSSFKMRVDRLATPGVYDKRVSAGCVVVPVAFYEKVVQRVLGRGPGVVYVMPERMSSQGLFREL